MNFIQAGASNVNRRFIKNLLSNRAFHVGAILQDKKNFYEVLRVPPDASQTQIKEAYYKLSKVYHPDIARDENSLKMFRSVTEAYDVLGNVRTRLQYDKESGITVPKDDVEFRSSTVANEMEFRAVYPDFKKAIEKKPPLQQWEDDEYRERRTEKLAKKHNWYVNSDDFMVEKDEKRILFFGMVMAVVMYTLRCLDWRYYERYLDPPPNKDSEEYKLELLRFDEQEKYPFTYWPIIK